MMAWLRRLHAWAGLVLCLFMALLALTGCILVFEPQIRDFGRPVGPAPSLGAQVRIVEAAQARFGAGQIGSIIFSSGHAALNEVRLTNEGKAWLDRDGRPVDGVMRDQAYEWIFNLHHHLLSGETGTKVVGWIGLIGVLMSISGLILWWPSRRSFQAAVVPRRKGRAGLLGAHRDLALMVAPLITLSMFTGAGMALPDIYRPLFQAPAPKAPKAAPVTAGGTDWPKVLAGAQGRFPDAVVRMAIAPPKPGAPASVRLKQPGEWHANGRTVVYLDPPTGQVLGAYDAQDQGQGARVFNSFWPVHAARVGGVVWQLFIFTGGLGLSALSLYGGEAYRRKLFAGRRRA